MGEPNVESDATELGAQSRYLVVFRSETLPADAGTRVAKAGGAVARSLGPVGVALAVGNAQFADRLAKDPAVLAVGREHYFRGTPSAHQRMSDAATYGDTFGFYQWDMERIGAPDSWLRGTPAASVAVLDSGITHDHPDLAANVVYSISTNGCQRGEIGYPYYDKLVDLDTGEFCIPVEPYIDFHGTHVAGTIGARRNNVEDFPAEWGGFTGVAGVAPTAQLASYKVFDLIAYTENGQRIVRLGAADFAIFDAIVAATLDGHKVINMSLGGPLDRSDRGGNAAYVAWDRVAKWANRNGTLIVAAAGNDTTNNNGTVAFIPSDLASVFSVSATGTSQLVFDGTGLVAAPLSDVLTFYSNYGASVDISAPGGDCGPAFPNECWVEHLILSTCPFPDGSPGWCWAAGTSMASPHVAGAAALVRGLHPDWTPGQVRSHLKDTASYVGVRQGFGAGLLNVDMAAR